jgi:CRISPR-associated protein Cmr3
MKLFIEPNDILMFRDGKPFSGGDDHFARGSFPPAPSTIYGALRSHILSIKSGEFDTFKKEPNKIDKKITNEIGTPDGIGSLTITRFTLAKKNSKSIEQYFPMPRDIAKNKGKENGRLYILKPNTLQKTAMTDLPAGLINMWYPSEDAMEAVSGFLSLKEMADYLIGKVPSILTETKELFDTEERTGIRKSKTSRSVHEGGLYSVEYFRLNEGVGFAVEIENTKLLPTSGILRLGGDNRSANYTEMAYNEISDTPIKAMIDKTKRFKLVLTTPSIFKNGWIPEGIDSNKMQGQINGIEVKLISVCIGKPVGIGGYDFAKNHPKVMKKAVPTGSIYYFELKNSNVDGLFESLWLKSISDEKAQEGFGITLIGGY